MRRKAKSRSPLITLGMDEEAKEKTQAFTAHIQLAVCFVVNCPTLADNGSDFVVFSSNCQAVSPRRRCAPCREQFLKFALVDTANRE